MLDISILTPHSTFLQIKARSITAPGLLGSLQILSNHAPLIAVLQAGSLAIDSHRWTITGGIVEVANNRVTLLVDAIEKN